MRLYSLFEKNGNRRWQRVTPQAYKLDVARRVFQDRLIASAFGGDEMRLRPVKTESELEYRKD